MSSVGEALSRTRKKQGESIVQIEEATKIPAKYIKALETDQYHNIPGDVYVKGFLRTYASYLGLDASQLIEQYKKIEMPPLPKKEPETSLVTPVARRNPKKKIVALAAVVTVIAVLGGLRWLGSVEEKPVKVLGKKVTNEKKDTEKKSKPESESQEQPVQVPVQGVKVKVEVIDEQGCWVRVLADGNKVFEDTLQMGEEKEWEASQSIYIRAGRPGGLKVTHNGKDIGLFGEANSATEATFGPEPPQQ